MHQSQNRLNPNKHCCWESAGLPCLIGFCSWPVYIVSPPSPFTSSSPSSPLCDSPPIGQRLWRSKGRRFNSSQVPGSLCSFFVLSLQTVLRGMFTNVYALQLWHQVIFTPTGFYTRSFCTTPASTIFYRKKRIVKSHTNRLVYTNHQQPAFTVPTRTYNIYTN